MKDDSSSDSDDYFEINDLNFSWIKKFPNLCDQVLQFYVTENGEMVNLGAG